MIELIFIHIYKTAGQSLRDTLRRVYGQDKYYRLNIGRFLHPEQKKALKSKIPLHITVLNGHFTYSDIAPLVNAETKVVTWLRDPVDRVLSDYYFWRRKISEGLRPGAEILEDKSLPAYARKEKYRNVMSVFLEGIKLEDLYFFGTVSGYTEDLAELSRLLKWKEYPDIHRNINKEFKTSFPHPTETELEEIRMLNEKDLELYKNALHLQKSRREGIAPLS